MDTEENTTTKQNERKTEHDFFLRAPLSYSSGADQRDATFIKLFAPSSKVSRECSALKQAFLRAVPKNVDKSEAAAAAASSGSTDDLNGSDVIEVLAMSTAVDLPDVLEVGKRLLLAPNIAKVEGEVKLTSALMDRLDQEDFENMLGEYMANFTLASVLSKTKKS